jgi:hypothetical protein
VARLTNVGLWSTRVAFFVGALTGSIMGQSAAFPSLPWNDSRWSLRFEGGDGGARGLFQAHSILKFFDLAGVEKFKRRWARGERL